MTWRRRCRARLRQNRQLRRRRLRSNPGGALLHLHIAHATAGLVISLHPAHATLIVLHGAYRLDRNRDGNIPGFRECQRERKGFARSERLFQADQHDMIAAGLEYDRPASWDGPGGAPLAQGFWTVMGAVVVP